MKTRREFLAATGIGLLGTAVSADGIASPLGSGGGAASAEQNPTQVPEQEPAGMPPAFGTAKPVGPEVSVETFVQAEKLVQVELKDADIAQAGKTWRVNMAPLYERRVERSSAVVAVGSGVAGDKGRAGAQPDRKKHT